MKTKTMIQMTLAFGAFLVAGMTAAFGQEAAHAAAASDSVMNYLAWASGIGLGLAAIGCGLGQGKMVASAMDGIARNPGAAKDMFVPMILGLAFIEALTIYALILPIIFKLVVLG